MQDLLLLLPTIFCYWTGLLIAWSAIAVVGLSLTIHKIKQKGYVVRQSDRMARLSVFMGGSILTISLFAFPGFTSNIIDAMVIIDLWYTVFLAYITGSSLAGWPVVHFNPAPRKF